MPDHSRDNIIDDLLLKRPQGPTGVSLTYENERYYEYEQRDYRYRLIPSIEHYGYSVEDLFNLELHTIDSVRTYVKDRWGTPHHDLPPATVTRRSRRIWYRIRGAVRQLQRKGTQGIYAITQKYGTTHYANIFARDNEEALILYKTFFPNINEDLSATFVEIGDVTTLKKRNDDLRKKMEYKRESAINTIRRFEKKLEKLANHLHIISTLEGHQIAVDGTLKG
tara:strand:+ start:3940 stop:4608 length:669 start_codon:yes stop_codon:yes gene_type:complete